MTELKNNLINKISNWLMEEDQQYFSEKDPTHNSEFLLVLKPLEISIVKPKKHKKLLVAWRLIIPKNDQKLYKTLKEENRKNFVLDLTRDLLLIGLIPKFEPPTPIENIQSIQVLSEIYFDGLTKNKLFEEINRVKSGYGILMVNLEKNIPSFRPVNDSDLV